MEQFGTAEEYRRFVEEELAAEPSGIKDLLFEE
jgi:hypothetical protein